MAYDIFDLEKFLTEVGRVLDETESNLHELAQETLLKYEQLLLEPGNGRGQIKSDQAVRLQQVGQQLARLSEQSRALHTYLQKGFDAPPVDNSYWPRIRILQSHEEERAQLAHDLENSVGQLLANAVFELASCRTLLASDKEAVGVGLAALQAELENGLADIRQFIVDLEPATILGNFGLGAGIRRYLEQFETRTGLKTQLRVNINIGRLPSIIEITIFRVIQEALSNAYLHAHATQIEVVIEEKEGALHFSIIDNGIGLNMERVGKSRKNLGLARMVDYAELLNGKFRILSDSERGTQIILSVPYPEL
ncbi:MAG: sensor histidine kinase [Chloroflexi bacterium]|nr:sensor histidine kinase [Chloroflexota bacterium]